jgi:very-short-patch-repair endonuclease
MDAAAESATIELHDLRATHFRPSVTAPSDVVGGPVVAAIARRAAQWLQVSPPVPSAGYVVDVICIHAKLIVEIDGRQHAWEADYDAERSRVLEEMGLPCSA